MRSLLSKNESHCCYVAVGHHSWRCLAPFQQEATAAADWIHHDLQTAFYRK
jgi:hypothetical protein